MDEKTVVKGCDEFGKMLKERRKELHYTQSYLSDYTGLSVSFLSNLENGKETAELGKALYYSSILGLDVEIKKRD
jgi:transcriptional regulator with XRE-family HTH domain